MRRSSQTGRVHLGQSTSTGSSRAGNASRGRGRKRLRLSGGQPRSSTASEQNAVPSSLVEDAAQSEICPTRRPLPDNSTPQPCEEDSTGTSSQSPELTPELLGMQLAAARAERDNALTSFNDLKQQYDKMEQLYHSEKLTNKILLKKSRRAMRNSWFYNRSVMGSHASTRT